MKKKNKNKELENQKKKRVCVCVARRGGSLCLDDGPNEGGRPARSESAVQQERHQRPSIFSSQVLLGACIESTCLTRHHRRIFLHTLLHSILRSITSSKSGHLVTFADRVSHLFPFDWLVFLLKEKHINSFNKIPRFHRLKKLLDIR